MADINAFPWVDLAVLPPGQSHYWFFDMARDARGWVFQATAHPEPPDDGEADPLSPSRVEVTELFILQDGAAAKDGKSRSRVNITVTNCGEGWAPYSLWVVALPPRSLARHRIGHAQEPRKARRPAART